MDSPTRNSSFKRPKQSSTRDDGRPRRRFGQNFLTDASAIGRIVAALAPVAGESVLEIGPGRGALTDALLAQMASMSAIEIDRELAARLRARYPDDRLRLIERDVLSVSFEDVAERTPVLVVGNLPYNISKPVAMKLVVERRSILRAVLMFQREVAERLSATPGTGAYGPLTVLAGRAYKIERLFDLPPGAFHPRPKVVSSVTRWIPRGEESLPESLVAPLRAVLSAAFGHRRQTLKKNLRAVLVGGEAEAAALLEKTGLDGSVRAEVISPEGFVALASAWPLPPRP